MMKMRLTEEMKAIIEELYQAMDMDCVACCEQCPYAEQCEQHELWWGCGVWEEIQG